MTDMKDLPDLPPGRMAALRKWLHAANARLLAIERTRQELTDELEPIDFYARAYRQILRGEPVK